MCSDLGGSDSAILGGVVFQVLQTNYYLLRQRDSMLDAFGMVFPNDYPQGRALHLELHICSNPMIAIMVIEI